MNRWSPQCWITVAAADVKMYGKGLAAAAKMLTANIEADNFLAAAKRWLGKRKMLLFWNWYYINLRQLTEAKFIQTLQLPFNRRWIFCWVNVLHICHTQSIWSFYHLLTVNQNLFKFIHLNEPIIAHWKVCASTIVHGTRKQERKRNKYESGKQNVSTVTTYQFIDQWYHLLNCYLWLFVVHRSSFWTTIDELAKRSSSKHKKLTNFDMTRFFSSQSLLYIFDYMTHQISKSVCPNHATLTYYWLALIQKK